MLYTHLTHPASLTLALLLATLAMFIWGKLRYDIIAMSALFLAVVIGIVPANHFFSGLAQPAVTTVACIMILSKAIADGGLIETFSDRALAMHSSFYFQMSLLCLITLVLSAFINNIGALSLAMPMAFSLCQKHKKSPSLVLMPIALCAALGGLTTLIGTPANLIISEFRAESMGTPFNFFDFAWVSVPIALIGFVFLIVIGWRLMPSNRQGKTDVLTFDIQDYLAEVVVTENSKIIGLSIREVEDDITSDAIIVGIIRREKRRMPLTPSEKIAGNDILIIEAAPDVIKQFLFDTNCHLHDSDKKSALDVEGNELIEVVVPPNASLEGRSSRQLRLRTRYHLTLLGIARRGKTIRERIHQTKLKAGDVLLMQGPQSTLKDAASQLGLLPLKGRNIQLPTRSQRILPLLFFILAIISTSCHLLPSSAAFAGAIICSVLTRSISIRSVYKTVDWPIITLLAALIPIGHALQHSGGTELVSQWLYSSTHTLSPMILVGIIMAITMMLSDIMNNAATAVIMAPIAISLAHALGMNPDAFLMAVAIGASCSFLTPIGHQNSILIMGPGGYRFSDYMRLGLPLELIILAVASPLICWAWPLINA